VPENDDTVNVTIDPRRIESDVAGRLEYQMGDALDRVLREKVAGAVEDQIATIVREKVEPMVVEAIERGWAEHTRWGDPTGKRVTLKERVDELLRKKGDRGSIGVNRGSKTLLEDVATQVITATLEKEMKQELADAKKAFRQQVDDILAGKLTEALRDAVGLRK